MFPAKLHIAEAMVWLPVILYIFQTVTFWLQLEQLNGIAWAFGALSEEKVYPVVLCMLPVEMVDLSMQQYPAAKLLQQVIPRPS